MVGRIFAFITVVPTILAHAILSCFAAIDRSSAAIANLRRCNEILLRHQAIEIIFATGNDFVQSTVAGVAFAGFSIQVLYNFIAIKMWDIIPMPLYLFFPAAGVIHYAGGFLLIDLMAEVFSRDAKIHGKWKRGCYWSLDRKLLTRRLRARKVIRISAGVCDYKFFELKRDFQSRYNYELSDYTVNALLSIRVDVKSRTEILKQLR